MPNLLQKASIVLTPTAYDDGKVLCAKPSEPPYGDFDFSRNSAATRVNAQGLVENVQTLSGNLVQNGDFSELGSEQIVNGNFETNSSWDGNFTIANGQLTKNDTGLVRQYTLDVSVKSYKVVVDVETIGASLTIYLGGTQQILSQGINTIYMQSGGSNSLVGFNNGNGAVINSFSVKELGQNWTLGTGWSIAENKAVFDGGSDSNLSSAFSVTNGKSYKYSFTVSDMNNGALSFRLGSSSSNDLRVTSNGSYSGQAVSDGTVIRFRAESGFNGSVTNISVKEIIDDTNLPRINYEGGCGHWLFEPQSTNLVTYSEDIASNNFYEIGTSIQSDVTTSPDGTINADLNQENNTNGSHFIYKDFNLSSGQTYTISVFAKSNGVNRNLRFGDGGVGWSSGFNANFDLTNGTTSGGVIESYGNGWYRCSVVGTTNATASRLIVYNTLNTSTSYQGDGSSGVFLFGFQIEQQSYATSYIPTDGSTVTRNQDVCDNGGSLASINSTEGVLYAEIAALTNDATRRTITISDGTTSNRIVLRYDNASNRIQGFIQVGGSTNGNINTTSFTITNFLKIAYKWKAGDFALWVNGTEVGTSTDATSFAPDVLEVVEFNFPFAQSFYGKTKALAVWKEALSDEELTELTTT